MATLVLTAVGSAIGGPIGGAIGAIAGQQFDQNILFKPKGREGPRLQELAVQTSSYGSQIPRIYGRMRVAGTVIWATDLKESRSQEGGGKGKPSTTIYSYSACFAVALSSRRIRDIGRIWADGKVFRGAAGDFKTETQFAFHPGGEDQAVDGLMASAEAIGGTPAYRGLALAVFGDMDLTDYGNRIPSLTFEVIAEDGSVAIADIISDISGQRMAPQLADKVIGFSAGGEDRQAAIQSFSNIIPLSFSSDPEVIDYIGVEVRSDVEAGSVQTIDSDFVRTLGLQKVKLPESRTASAASTPRKLSVRYYDSSRDYQSGIQSASRPGKGRTTLVREFPAAMAADDVRAIATMGLWSVYDERSTMYITVLLQRVSLRPGMLLEFTAFEGLWRIRECEIGFGFVQLSLTRARGNEKPITIESDHGRNVPDSDLRAGATRLLLVDLPFAIDAPSTLSDTARLYAAAAGGEGWRNAQLFADGGDGAPGEYIGQIPAPSLIGITMGSLNSANPALIDLVNHIEVDLHNPGMVLTHANDAQLLAGRNIALIGQEIIQFAEALPLGAGRFRLSRLIRGLGGTEMEIERHSANEDFVLLDAGSMLDISAVVRTPFTPSTIFALGRDDLVPVPATALSPGRALMPWFPVHPTSSFLAGGELEIGWMRRSRAGLFWLDHVEVPLGEEIEKYRIELSADSEDGARVIFESLTPKIIIAPADIAPFLLLNGSSLNAKISQVGDYGLSEVLTLTIPL